VSARRFFPLRSAEFADRKGRKRSVRQRFTLDRQSFEQLIAAVSLFQPLQQAAATRINVGNPPLLLYLLEILQAIDSGSLDLQALLERVAGLALHIVGGDRAALWLFTSQLMICRATAGANFDEGQIRASLWSTLQSGGAFGDDPPSKLDLTRTLEKCSRSPRSSLAIAILPGAKIAGALAVFSNQSATFTARDYANLRLLAGLAQYVLTKTVVAPQPQDSLDDWLEENLESNSFLEIHAASSMERSPTAPLISPRPEPESFRHGQLEDVYVPPVGTPVALGGSIKERSQTGTGLQSLSASAPGFQERKQRFQAAAFDAVRNSLRCLRDVRVNWITMKQAAFPLATLAVMSSFVGLLTTARQPLVGGSLTTTAKTATAPVPYNSANRAGQSAAAVFSPKKLSAVPIEASHLQITDRQTAATIAEMSKYEVQNLRRAADYGDDQAELQLGMLYELGHGFPQSCNQAAKWVTKAAEHGNAAAEYNLGLRYRDGDGVDANLQQAENWLRRAVAHKNSNAHLALDALPSHHQEISVGKIGKTSLLAFPTP